MKSLFYKKYLGVKPPLGGENHLIDKLKLMKQAYVFFFSVLLVTAITSCKDELQIEKPPITDGTNTVQINFSSNQDNINESESEKVVSLMLSKTILSQGSIEITLSAENDAYGKYFTTVPQAVNGKINIVVNPGADQAELKIVPVNNEFISGNVNINLMVTATGGSISKGNLLNHAVSIIDDELNGISKSYSVKGGNWEAKKYYGYREDGLLSKVYWENYTPGKKSGSQVYHYNANGQLVKMTESGLGEIIYTWVNNKIIKQEEFQNGTLKKYMLYRYDNAGNIKEASIYNLLLTGELKLNVLLVFQYTQDGNISKQLTYSINDKGESFLVSTKMYGNYLSKENPFSMVEILPNINSQPKLPGFFRLIENGLDIQYNFSYEFDNKGRPTKRIATSTYGNEVANYQYY